MAKKVTELTLDMVRERVLADPNTAKIAKELGIPLEQYVVQVCYFVLNPDADPDVILVEDADLIKMGHTPPKESQMLAYIKEAVAVSDASGDTSGFEGAKRKKVSLDGGGRKRSGTTGTHSNAHLQDELKKQMRKSKKG